MQYIDIVLIALVLCFDTFAVSVSTGLIKNDIKFKEAVPIALIFGMFQSLMPFIGWLGGIQVKLYMSDYDHWIALVLLSLLGSKMIIESLKEPEEKKFDPMKFSVIVGMALATSIDALVVGVTFALMKVNIWTVIAIIGFITYLTAMLGILIGKKINGIASRYIETLGGIILIGIGIKIVLEHLEII